MADLKIVKGLSNNRYTVTPTLVDLTTVETDLVEDFGEPIVTMGGAINVVSTTTALNVGTITGEYSIGEIVEGQTSGATAIVFYVTGNIIYVTGITGTFGPSNVDVIEGADSGATSTIITVGSTITQFQARYGIAPQSTENFTSPQLIRRIPSQLGQTITFDGNLKPEAEQNANDYIETIKVIINEAWTVLTGKIDNYEGTELVPVPFS